MLPRTPAYRPYRWATVDFSLGLRPARPAGWIEFTAEHEANMREKRARLAADGARYYRALPESLYPPSANSPTGCSRTC